MKKSWLDDRYSWLDADGRPEQEDWTNTSECTSGEAEEMAFIEPCIVDAKFTKDYTIVRGGEKIVMPVIDLDFEGSEIFEAELLDEMTKTPKQRRLERRKEMQDELDAVDKGKKTKKLDRKSVV